MNKILITGASGNIGTPLVEALRLQGADFEIMRSKADTTGSARVASFSEAAGLQSASAPPIFPEEKTNPGFSRYSYSGFPDECFSFI